MKKISVESIFTLFFLALSLTAFSQQPAFPGAEGAGMFTSGGRGTALQPTTVFEVTSLDDTNVPGTLRYAVNASKTTYPHRTIVFRVSGTIHLTSKLNIPGNTTIAGQTAPGGGICLAGHPVVISGDNVIIRYLRCRMGDKNQLKTTPSNCGVPVAPFSASCMPLDGSGGDDALGNLGNKNLIIDHCSISWSNDEAFTVYRGDSITLQWNLISEPLNYSYHFETGDTDFEQHGYGGIWGARHGSFHHNLFAHCRNRTPRWAGNGTYNGDIESGDFRNNVMYNWGINNVYGGDGGQYNLVNNYYKYGPNTSSGVRYRIVTVDRTDTYGWAKYYLSGNYVDGSGTNTANNWTGAYLSTGSQADSVNSKQTVPYLQSYPQITTQSAVDAYNSVLTSVGAILPQRDTLDQRIINNVINRTGKIIDVQGGFPHATPYASTVNAWPTLANAIAPIDTDHDGMPDDWENANGLNPNNAADRQYVAMNGYTNLENYLNGISSNANEPQVLFAGSVVPFSQIGDTPSDAQIISISGSQLLGDITLTAPAGFEISTNGSTWINSSGNILLNPVSGTLTATNLHIRLNASLNGVFGGNILATTPGASGFPFAISGTRSLGTETADTASWLLLVDPNPTITGNLNATSQTIGSAISGILYGSSFSGTTGWQRVATNGLPIGYNADSYVEYSVTPQAGKIFTAKSLDLDALGGGTGTAKLAIYYSLDGFASSNSIGAIHYNNTDYTNTTIDPVSLLNTSTSPLTGQEHASSNFNIQVNAGQTLGIRMFVWITGTGTRYFPSKLVTLAGTTKDVSLPLAFTNFGAAQENNQVKLNWAVANENGLRYYEIESSSNGTSFKSIGKLNAGAGSYLFSDPELLQGIKYYRIKMINADGSFTYSKIIAVNAANAGKFSLYPNPTTGILTVTHSLTTKPARFALLTSDGKILNSLVLPAGATQGSFDVSKLPPGTYFIQENGTKKTAWFIKQ